jgi:hypothetical protein
MRWRERLETWSARQSATDNFFKLTHYRELRLIRCLIEARLTAILETWYEHCE